MRHTSKRDDSGSGLARLSSGSGRAACRGDVLHPSRIDVAATAADSVATVPWMCMVASSRESNSPGTVLAARLFFGRAVTVCGICADVDGVVAPRGRAHERNGL